MKRWENEARIQKLSFWSDQAGCLGAWGPGSKARKVQNGFNTPFELPFETGAKFEINPRELQNEANLGQNCFPKGALEASTRPLGAESGFRVLFGVTIPQNRQTWS